MENMQKKFKDVEKLNEILEDFACNYPLIIVVLTFVCILTTFVPRTILACLKCVW